MNGNNGGASNKPDTATDAMLLAAAAAALLQAWTVGSTPQAACSFEADAETLPLLHVFAKHLYDWSSSTTPAPISQASILAKRALVGKVHLDPLADLQHQPQVRGGLPGHAFPPRCWVL